MIEKRLWIWGVGLALISMTPSDLHAQEVIYVRAPVTVGGQAVADGQTVPLGATLISGAGGMIIVELPKWPSSDANDCSLFVIASGGRSAEVPRRRGAQPSACGGQEQMAMIDQAFRGRPVSASVLLIPQGKADGRPDGLTDAAIFDRLGAIASARRKARQGAAGGTKSAGATPNAGGNPKAAVPGGLTIESATYGANCGAPAGNMTSRLAEACNGNGRCDYVINYQVIGDPAPGCAKDYRATFRCPGTQRQTLTIDGEAGFKSVLRIACQ